MQKNDQDHSFIIASTTHGERLCIARFVADTCGSLARLLRRRGVHDSDTDDVQQRVYLVFAARLSRIRPGAERAYLYAIAAREAGHQRRSYRRRREQPDDGVEQLASSDARPDVLAQRKETHCRVRAVLASMDEALRHVLVSFALEHMSLAEIAHASALPLGTVKSRLRRARQRFAHALEREGELPRIHDELR